MQRERSRIRGLVHGVGFRPMVWRVAGAAGVLGEVSNGGGDVLIEVQHHHVHIATALAGNGHRLDAGPVMGIALDGLGMGSEGTPWGGGFLRADYRGLERLAHLPAVPCPAVTRPCSNPGVTPGHNSGHSSAGRR